MTRLAAADLPRALAPRPSRGEAPLLLAAVLSLCACGPKHIPGTQIPDDPDTRAIVQVMEQYRRGMEDRNAAAVFALASPRYFDNAGTPEPADDVDYAQLQKLLPERLAKLAAVRLNLEVRTVDVKGDTATSQVYYDEHFRIVTPRGDVAKQESDVHEMKFQREGGAWKILSGL